VFHPGRSDVRTDADQEDLTTSYAIELRFSIIL
jgi:hypothetical protein